MPLLGNPTAAVLYPGKLIFAAASLQWAARIYIVAHSVLAFVAMLVLMRSWGISWAGSGLSALSYTFGAPILFQYCNIIYLVGAAWLPLGMHAVDRWVRLGRRWAIVELAVVLGMQVLGGDPQSAFLLGIAGLGYAAGAGPGPHGERSARIAARRGNRTSQARRAGSADAGDGSRPVLALWFVATVILGVVLPKLRPRPRSTADPSPALDAVGALASSMRVWLAGR